MRVLAVVFLMSGIFTGICMAEPHAYPVPFTSKSGVKTITFADLPADGTIKIYSVDGRKVKELTIPTGLGIKDWDLTNTKNEQVATGVYLFDINGFKGKVVIIR